MRLGGSQRELSDLSSRHEVSTMGENLSMAQACSVPWGCASYTRLVVVQLLQISRATEPQLWLSRFEEDRLMEHVLAECWGEPDM